MIEIIIGHITTRAQRAIHNAHIINARKADNMISSITLSMILIILHISRILLIYFQKMI